MCDSMRSIALVEDRSYGEIVLDLLERLLDLCEPHVVAPQRRRILAGQIGAQQVAALAAPGAAQAVAPQRRRSKVSRGHRLSGLGQADIDQVPGASRLLLGGPELQQRTGRVSTIARDRLVQAPPERFLSRRRRMPRSFKMRARLWAQDVELRRPRSGASPRRTRGPRAKAAPRTTSPADVKRPLGVPTK